MSSDVKIVIDRSQQKVFSNRDTIRGKVQLNVRKALSLKYIEVKLEGIAKTELQVPRIRNNKEKIVIVEDSHRVLYDTTVVFPPANVKNISSAKEFTLAAGSYTYPFEFEIPMNNACVKRSGITNKISFDPKRMDLRINNGNFDAQYLARKGGKMWNEFVTGPQPTVLEEYHVDSQLPPSMVLNDSTSIKYFVKVTCKRSAILKANYRAFDPFVFMPMDTAPKESGHREAVLRKDISLSKEIYNRNPPQVNQPSGRRGLLSRFFNPVPPIPTKDARYQKDSGSFNFSVEARLKHPVSLVPKWPLDFRLLVSTSVSPQNYSEKAPQNFGVIYLQRLNIDLRALTPVSVVVEGQTREQHFATFDNSYELCRNKYNNLAIDLRNSAPARPPTSYTDVAGNAYEFEIPKKYYENCIVPANVVPSFTTCNISRKYTLHISVGFSAHKTSDSEDDENIAFVDLALPDTTVSSGIGLPQSTPNYDSPVYDSPVQLSAAQEKARLASSDQEAETSQHPQQYTQHDTQHDTSDIQEETHDTSEQLPSYEEVWQQPSSSR